jgi:peroxiredoxin Q/BCP
MLEVGDKAPEFSVLNQIGETVSLSQFKGKKVALYFYPKDDTPGCTIEAIAFTKLKAQFEAANTVILGVSKDSVESHQHFCTKYDLTVQLLSDNDMAIIEPYGVWQEKKNYGKTYMGISRTTYLIDEDGKIAKVWKNVKAEGHAEAVYKVVSGE